jgi:hypothetical protein
MSMMVWKGNQNSIIYLCKSRNDKRTLWKLSPTSSFIISNTCISIELASLLIFESNHYHYLFLIKNNHFLFLNYNMSNHFVMLLWILKEKSYYYIVNLILGSLKKLEHDNGKWVGRKVELFWDSDTIPQTWKNCKKMSSN